MLPSFYWRLPDWLTDYCNNSPITISRIIFCRKYSIFCWEKVISRLRVIYSANMQLNTPQSLPFIWRGTPWTDSIDHKITGVERLLAFIHRFIFEVLFQCLEYTGIWCTHGIVVFDGTILYVYYSHTPMDATNVYGHWHNVLGKDIDLTRPALNASMARLH